VLMEVICERSRAASEAFDAWPADGAVAAIVAAVQDHPPRSPRTEERRQSIRGAARCSGPTPSSPCAS
jgi:hypothetical protein